MHEVQDILDSAENGVIRLGIANSWDGTMFYLWRALWKLRISNSCSEQLSVDDSIRTVERSFDIAHNDEVYTVVYIAQILD